MRRTTDFLAVTYDAAAPGCSADLLIFIKVRPVKWKYSLCCLVRDDTERRSEVVTVYLLFPGSLRGWI